MYLWYNQLINRQSISLEVVCNLLVLIIGTSHVASTLIVLPFCRCSPASPNKVRVNKDFQLMSWHLLLLSTIINNNWNNGEVKFSNMLLLAEFLVHPLPICSTLRPLFDSVWFVTTGLFVLTLSLYFWLCCFTLGHLFLVYTVICSVVCAISHSLSPFSVYLLML